jgi:hypothetical protein
MLGVEDIEKVIKKNAQNVILTPYTGLKSKLIP